MGVAYAYRNDSDIQNNLFRIETAKRVIDFLPQFPHIEESIRRSSLLKSSLFSARIEGNRLRLEEVEVIQKNISKNREKQEVANIARALEWIYSRNSPKNISIKVISRLHAMVLQNISFDAGRFRTEPSAIFNQAGVAIYLAPPHYKIQNLLAGLVKTIQKSKEHAATKAALAHFAFEKIHPFIDGNGRVGRLLSTHILKNNGYGFRGLATFEKYLSDHRITYYDTLSFSTKDITEFVRFFTQAIAASAEETIELLKNKTEEKPEESLLPRRGEILAIVREHSLVSFNFIKRRFQKVPDSSLHYDIRILLKLRLIKKLGTTRGVLYAAR